MQFDGPNDDIMAISPLKEKMESFGFVATEVDGHNICELWNAFTVEHKDKPLAIIARTIKAHGIPSLEGRAESHHASLPECDYQYFLNRLKLECND
jgi:transketolase